MDPTVFGPLKMWNMPMTGRRNEEQGIPEGNIVSFRIRLAQIPEFGYPSGIDRFSIIMSSAEVPILLL